VYGLSKVQLLDERYSTVKICSGALLLFKNLLVRGHEKPGEVFRVASSDEDTSSTFTTQATTVGGVNPELRHTRRFTHETI
jgi:hypothetical protein